ncbi:MAG: diaminopimelate decarboxylase [Bdellovibrionales bacterium CG12_big_fil_rev_8_21_14_0_65_38_15]|nr:MAG: diaminopimelate decarboxylase [Bdellovibrionales bacterium CG22_combo_CG10-13_8_21_14_all_38_13]PIQ56842.1 MAG: diaminopimelate decarboxylase [Bdellovibrionales bacterium CG12_big_fil_rev_8_21_14_0_65_38_15]PIR29763.1 MAG: diaminopimelate decarboxylase [Bdellovibrionales bacterium CG11_big_fil_rev_8_21_14_0_20_38_13]
MKKTARAPLEMKSSVLHFDGKSLSEIVKNIETPFYLYSEKVLTEQYLSFIGAAKDNNIPNPLVCFALKANPNPWLVSTLSSLGSGADTVSGGEMKRALESGIDASKIVFSGVAKNEKEIRAALQAGILSINVESVSEMEMIAQCAQELGVKAQVALRINPKVNVITHKHISTGNKSHKFGMLTSDARDLIKDKSLWEHVDLVGLSIHIGSQLTDLTATSQAIKEMVGLANEVSHPLKFIDVGGGLGIDYSIEDEDKISSPQKYMAIVSDALSGLKQKDQIMTVFEPGRFIAARCGVLVSKIVRTKSSEDYNFAILDAGMNDFARPAIYDAHHEIYPLEIKNDKTMKWEVVGPICETTDCFAKQRELPELKAKDYLVIADAGAYGRSMASHYNLRDIAKEYCLDKNQKVTLV